MNMPLTGVGHSAVATDEQSAHSSCATCSTSNMSFKRQRNLTMGAATLLLSTLLLSMNIQLAEAVKASPTPKSAHAPVVGPIADNDYVECTSIDIRNHCDNFHQLDNCTVITGFLLVVLLPPAEDCDYNSFSFPKLREITDFLMISDLRNMTSLQNLFPNLTVIRGRRIFHNYALGVSKLQNTTAMAFPSLVAIQRGHVFVGFNPHLCYLDTISFDRLTLSPGENHIMHSNETACPPPLKCLGCDTGYCWPNGACQKFENDNVMNLQSGINNCHPECLGGCLDTNPQSCAVCRHWTNHGTCVAKCPEDLYSCEHYMRCYTREECIQRGMLIHRNNCVSSCPAGTKFNNVTRECDSCAGVNGCPRVCNGYTNSDGEVFILIQSLSEAHDLIGCQILNATVYIQFMVPIDERELMVAFKEVREIRGHLKILKSPYLSSLSFLANLRKINGTPSFHDQYALVIYQNLRLRELWTSNFSLELGQGGMLIQDNEALCNRVIEQFAKSVIRDTKFDTIFLHDQEALCAPAKLPMTVKAISHRAIEFSWPIAQTSYEIEFMYRPVPGGGVFSEEKDLITNVCQRGLWERELKVVNDLRANGSKYYYTVDNLKSSTKYACVVKTFGRGVDHEARSELQYVTTSADIPPPPKVQVTKKTFESIAIELSYDNNEDKAVDFYNVEVYELPDLRELLNSRDYCEEPMKMPPDLREEDFEACCTRREEEREDKLFRERISKEFACTLDTKQYCERDLIAEKNTNVGNILFTKRLEHSETSALLRPLQRFHLYVIQVQACNSAGCGSFTMLSERTNYTLGADKLYDLTACRIPGRNEYEIRFLEPSTPNGLITSYAVHFRHFEPDSPGPYKSHMSCVSRQDHERNHYVYHARLKSFFNQATVRVESLGHHVFTDWVDIVGCDGSQLRQDDEGGHMINLFLICFLVGATLTVIWVIYKRRLWRLLPRLRQYMPVRLDMHELRIRRNTGDHQTLVEYDRVHFQTRPVNVQDPPVVT